MFVHCSPYWKHPRIAACQCVAELHVSPIGKKILLNKIVKLQRDPRNSLPIVSQHDPRSVLRLLGHSLGRGGRAPVPRQPRAPAASGPGCLGHRFRRVLGVGVGRQATISHKTNTRLNSCNQRALVSVRERERCLWRLIGSLSLFKRCACSISTVRQ